VWPKQSGIVLSAVIGLVALTGCAGHAAGEACEAPDVTITPTSVAPNGKITLSGANWQPCGDTNGATASPWTHVDVTWTRSGQVLLVGEIALENGAFESTRSMPATFARGEVTVTVTSPHGEVSIDKPFTVG
jgi:hypothetical protein